MFHPRHNLPLSTGEFVRFVGRERDIVDLARLLGSTRMVTLTGTGGIGKTRLALHVAERVLRRFPDGARFIDLSESSTHDQVLRTVANGLHAVEDGRRTTTEAIITLCGHRAHCCSWTPASARSARWHNCVRRSCGTAPGFVFS